MSQEDDPVKLSFNKGYTPEGFADRVYHLHVRYFGNWPELYFRDFLIAHPDVAGEYERLKLKLWKQYEHDQMCIRDRFDTGRSLCVCAF